jgi:hypothetical protein
MTRKLEVRGTNNMPGAYSYMVGWLSVEIEQSGHITKTAWNRAVEEAERFSAEEAAKR